MPAAPADGNPDGDGASGATGDKSGDPCAGSVHEGKPGERK
ncbi:hypothetical protein AB0L40_18620 [Patulibacter sp. NPDC049589]